MLAEIGRCGLIETDVGPLSVHAVTAPHHRSQRIVSRVISGQEETSQVGVETAFYGLPIRLFLNFGRKFFDTSERALRVVGFWDWTGAAPQSATASV
jgi:hypothetical protein